MDMSIKDKVTDHIPGYNKAILPYHLLKAEVSGVKYGFPGKKMTVIGVTGTNGKTSTSFMIWKMLNNSGRKTGLMTTVAWGGLSEMVGKPGDSGSREGDKDGLHKQLKHMTTVDSMTLNRRMKTILETGAEYLVLEVTSHAMVQFRTLGIPIEIAVMTNVTHEHLDYHKTFENYRDAKVKLFKKAKYGIANADDRSSTFFMNAVSDGTTYGINRGRLKAENIELSAEGVSYDVQDMRIKTRIPGKFMVYNSLAAVAVGQRLGLSEQEICDGIYALESVEGRMNRVEVGQDFMAIVDYAHTPDAFLKVYESVAPNKNGRIISLFGGAGRRDETTRDERGEIAAKYSDVCIITEDDSRDEDPEKIAKMFLVGCEREGMKLGEDVFIEIDRKKAIEKAVSLAKKGDIVLILGKGHEKTILRDDGPHPFEDLVETEKAIRKVLEK